MYKILPYTTLEDALVRIRKTFDVDFRELQIDDAGIYVLNILNMQKYLDKMLQAKKISDPIRDLPLWSKIWPGSFVLGRLLRKFEPQGKTLLELGCGCGILGLITSRYDFKHLVISDVNTDALLFAQANVLRNKQEQRIEIRQWDVSSACASDNPELFDVIAASELLYLDDLHRPLLQFLDRHLAPAGQAFFCTDLARNKPAFAQMAAEKFCIKGGVIKMKVQDSEQQEEKDYVILVLQRKNKS